MATLAEAIKDRRNYSDDTRFTAQNGFETTLGELRAFQDATGQDVAKAIESERTKLAEEQQKLAAAQEEVVNLWTKLQEAAGKVTNTPAPAAPGGNWMDDPFFAPVAKYLKENVEASVARQQEQITQFQKALGLGVKYIADTFSEMRYQSLPEDFRKEIGYEAAVKAAAEKKYLDSGGVPDIRKVEAEWRAPRERKTYEERVQKEAYDKARQDLMSNTLARPGGMPVAPAAPDPDAPKTIRESFNRLKQDPQFNEMIYGLTTGQQPN